jgi:hydroxymethylbilane synthase
LSVRIITLVSEGDRRTGSLADQGGKGLFVRRIEQALLSGEADLAVHSLKDMPVTTTPGLVIAATPCRGDVRDVLITADAINLDQLPANATIGTSSPRRTAQLRRLRDDLNISLLRGNVQTRIRKVVDDRQFDATVLSLIGLQRAGLGDYEDQALSLEQVMPAAGQGALALQCRADDHVTLRRSLPLNHAATATAVHAERAIIQMLGADCFSSIAAYAEVCEGDQLHLRARVLSEDGRQCAQAEETGSLHQVRQLCTRVVADLETQGAQQMLRRSPVPAGH